ncbi:MAG: ankyrin repeat domain-containing protein [Oscillatoria princeps RMCB-10]|jgi:ankyrin repeat protein|nr:ankyrin repeat domain-containing protein [Oscillatoria princeps RMCB-10]
MELLHQSGEIIASRYRILNTIGSGGTGTTYLAIDLQNNQQVALKALSLHMLTDWKKIELFEREARTLAQLNHAGIPRYLDYFQVETPEDRSFYIAQQLAEGKSLAALVESGWRTDEKGVRDIATQILEILAYLHSLKPPVTHRDIKPQNIIRREDGRVFLVDFGAVQNTYYNTFMRGSTVVGTYGYMAPEQFRGQAVPATDLYGLGATVLFLLTHRSPADLPLDGLQIDFRSHVRISEEFAGWLEKMLEPDVADRFSSAKEALAVLRGERVMASQARKSFPWKSFAVLVIVAGAAFTASNAFKWAWFRFAGIESFLCPAIYKGDINTIRDYLYWGGNPNAREKYYDHDSLLQCAVDSRNKDIAELLIGKGADINSVKNNERGETPLHKAASRGWKDALEVLIAKGADVNARDRGGDTPLHRAASYHSKEIVELLIASGADVNARNSWSGDTPLHRVSWKKEMAELLIAKGADVNAKNKEQGITLLHYAIRMDKYDLAELLIAKGADVNAKDNSGDTPLHIATEKNSSPAAQLLISAGANVNAKNNDGRTPIHIAAEQDSDLVAQVLIAAGADVNAKDNDEHTPLHIAAAAEKDSSPIAQLLIAKGANVNARDKKGHTPLHLAAIEHHTNLVELLKSHGGTE